jgi:hypothetical protein
MAEQTLTRARQTVQERSAAARPEARAGIDAAEALRQARTCLETADRRLRRGDAAQADEVLRLLQSATSLLETALFPVRD